MPTREMESPPEPKRCLGCGYILDGLPEPRCPECGRGFDPQEPGTYCVQVPSARRLLWAAIASAALAVGLTGSPVAKLVSEFEPLLGRWV
ncbi:MAG: hypothetical protein AB1716_19585 [Planctomycetota bacterium]